MVNIKKKLIFPDVLPCILV